jgi:hypothetical protein
VVVDRLGLDMKAAQNRVCGDGPDHRRFACHSADQR